MSPLSFVLVMDILSRRLDRAVNEGCLTGFTEGRNLMVSHLLFVDDSLILYDADLDQLLLIRMVVQDVVRFESKFR